MRAYVLARKGILMSNPDVKNMTITEWMFEYHALHKKEQALLDTSAKLFKNILVSVLGLNMLRPLDKDGSPKSFDDLTDQEKEAYTPMVMWCARSDMMKQLSEQMSIIAESDKAKSDEEYERLVASIDAADGDMEPILNIKPVSPTRKSMPQNAEVQQLKVDGKV